MEVLVISCSMHEWMGGVHHPISGCLGLCKRSSGTSHVRQRPDHHPLLIQPLL